jgi:PAS domain S-box-containing protein
MMATVLVVDDRATNRELARTLLGYRGHRVIEAHEGGQALAMAHEQHPDLVLTDLMMPGMDGYELARELRAAPDTATTPIVFYTANYQESETKPFADACGIARVLPKSSEPQELLAVIDSVLNDVDRAENVDVDEAARAHLRAVNAKLMANTKALSDTETRFRIMADSSPVGIIFGDPHGSASYVNTRLAQIVGLPTEDLLGLGWMHCVSDQYRDEILTAVRGQGPRDTQHRYHSQVMLPDESQRWLNVHAQTFRDDDAQLCGFIATVDDVTAVVEAEQQRRAAERRHDVEGRVLATERLESLSRIAGGVAHDFNNILGAILNFQSFVREAVEELASCGRVDESTAQALLEDLGQIDKAGKRAIGLTEQLLTFGSRSVINRTAMDLNQAVTESNDMLRPTIGGDITIVTRLAADLPQVLAEPTNLARILLNLTINSHDAMPDGGTLTITTATILTDGDTTGDSPTPPSQYARLTIRDTGTGMTPEVVQRAIEPFFTTKPRGQGTGLGLPIVYGIVNQFGGHLHIHSAPGRGTAITIDLPTTDEPIITTGPTTTATAGGTETILFAEDEDPMREAVTRTLTKAGYTVLAARGGPDALTLADNHPHHIHLLLTDVMMPDMLGNELASRLQQHRPDTPVLFMSGYAGDLMNAQGVLDEGVTALPKPFTETALLAAVRASLHVAQG